MEHKNTLIPETIYIMLHEKSEGMTKIEIASFTVQTDSLSRRFSLVKGLINTVNLCRYYVRIN